MSPRKPPLAQPEPEAGIRQLLELRHHDPFSLLGCHPLSGDRIVIRALLPEALRVEIAGAGISLEQVPGTALFSWEGPRTRIPARYRLRAHYPAGAMHEFEDPYCFTPQISDEHLQAFGRGEHRRAWHFLGARLHRAQGSEGVLFAVWAPEAARVSVVGDFNHWDGRRHMLRCRGSTGVWELFIPGLEAGAAYKYEICNRHSGEVLLKADPYGQCFELRPATASIVPARTSHVWSDEVWLARRRQADWLHAPMSIYELHLASWRRQPDGSLLDYRTAAEQLVPYVLELGFTHIELMPVSEHPLDESWGYQTTGYFAATRRHGDADGLRWLIDLCHQHGLGVLLDWVPGHFPRDAHGLARFDGSALYEYPDPARGHHPDWGTLIFNYGRNEVRSFLLSSAIYWLEEFHIDGLRVDAVASMLYLDYSRRAGEWQPNIHGGNENLDAISFLRELNRATHGEFPGSLTLAEESTAWPGVSRPLEHGGLGFSMKWNMGWMHDTLLYMARDPVYRRHHHDLLTFSAVYAFSENFVLPLSHDEVVHGKGSLLGKMPGDQWQRFANLRLTYAWQWFFPGKKLLFMGCELAQPQEWDHRGELAWQLRSEPAHEGIRQLVRDLNRLYREQPALHAEDFVAAGFQWLCWEDAEASTLAFMRCGGGQQLIVVLNCTPVVRHGYRIGVPAGGEWREIFSSDSRYYGGSDLGNPLPLAAREQPCMGQPCTLEVTLPPLAAIVLQPAHQAHFVGVTK